MKHIKREVFVCELCNATFFDIHEFTKHKITLGSFACGHCDAVFHTAEEVGDHTSTEHELQNFDFLLDGSFANGFGYSEKDSDLVFSTFTSHASGQEEKEKNKTDDRGIVLEGTTTIEPTIVHLLNSLSRETQPKRKNKRVTWQTIHLNCSVKDRDGMYMCTSCKKSFSKERQYLGHKCMGRGDFVGLTEKVYFDQEHHLDEEFDDEDQDPDFNIKDEDKDDDWDSDAFYNSKGETSELSQEELDNPESNAGVNKKKQYTRARLKSLASKILPIDAETEDDVELQASPSTELNKENHPVVASEAQEAEAARYDVPIFSTEEERMTFEEHVNCVDLSVVDYLLSKQKVSPNLHDESGHRIDKREPRDRHVYSCNVCQKVFEKKSNMRLHCLIHTDLRPFKCPECDFCSNAKCNLYSHMRKHTGNFFKCLYCDFKTCYSKQIMDHEAVHITVRKKRCQLCNKSYSTAGCLVKHVKRRHTDAQGRKYLSTIKTRSNNIYLCRVCNREFKQRVSRDRHMANHSSFNSQCIFHCGLCSYTATKRLYLENHYRKHRLVYVCTVCSKLYISATNLKEHLQDHLDDINRFSLSGVSLGSTSSLIEPKNGSSNLLDKGSTANGVSKMVDFQSSIEMSPEANENFDVFERAYPSLPALPETVSVNIILEKMPEIGTDHQISFLGNSEPVHKHSLPDCSEPSVTSSQKLVLPDKMVHGQLEQDQMVLDRDVALKHQKQLSSELETEQQNVLDTNVDAEANMSLRNQAVSNSKSETEKNIQIKHTVLSEERFQTSTNDSLASDSTNIASPSEPMYIDSEVSQIFQQIEKGTHTMQESSFSEKSTDELTAGSSQKFKQSHKAVIAPGATLESLFAESVNQSWYLPEPDGSLTSSQHVNIPEDLVEKQLNDDLRTNNENPLKSSAEEKKVASLHPSVSSILLANYKPLDVEVFKKIKEAFGDSECHTCGRLFHNKADLERHLLSHLEDKPFKCEHCNYTAASRDGLKRHQETNHEGKTYPCSQCDFIAQSKTSLWRHKQKHITFQGKCPVCKKDVSSWKMLRIHVLTEHPDVSRQEMKRLTGSYHRVFGRLGRRSFKCPYCSRIFQGSADVKKHIWVHEGIKPFKCPHCPHQSRSRNNLNIHILTHSSEKPHRCEDCGRTYKSKQALRLHFRQAHEKNRQYSCDKCDYSASLRCHLRRHMETHEKTAPYSCGKCDYSASQKGHLKRHMETHEKKILYSCDKCDYSASQRYHLKKHMETHEGKIIYSCDKCDYTSEEKSDLKKHMETHAGNVIFTCDKCDFTTTQSNNYKKHMETHEGKVLYGCDKCDYSTTQKCHLKRHMETHEGNVLYCCDRCDYSSTLKYHLKKHMESHEDNVLYTCDRCDFSTTKKTDFKRHLATHEGKIIYSCDKCDYSTTQKCHLKRHGETHEKNAHYSCDRCDFTTIQKCDFKKHMETHEGKVFYSCYKCDYNTTQRCHLKRHMETHERNVVYTCELCGFNTNQKCHLKRHMESHKPVRRFICEHCDYSSNSINYMKAHYARKHKEAAFTIGAVSNPVTLSEQNERIYKCLSCAYIFENMNDLKLHLQSEHGLSLESLDLNSEEGIQVEIVTDAEVPSEDTATETPEESRNVEVVRLQQTGQSSSATILPEAYQLIGTVDEESTSGVDIIQQIIEQGALDSQMSFQAVDADGQLVAVNPETIIVQEGGQEVVLDNSDGPYVIHYVTHKPSGMQEPDITLHEAVLSETGQ